MGWMDIATIAIMVMATAYGFFKGFVISFINMVGWIIAAICSMKFYPLVSEYMIEHTSIYSKILQTMNDKLASVSNVPMEEINFDISSYVKLPKVLQEGLVVPSSSNLIGGTLSEVISRLLLDIISMMIIFIVIKIVLIIVSRILDKCTKLPILNQVNKIFGLLFGFIQGAIIVLVILAMLVPLTGIFPNDKITEGLEGSTITKYLYDHNIILTFVEAAIDSQNAS